MLVGVFASEDFQQHWPRIVCSHDRVESCRKQNGARELAVPRVAMAETQWPLPGNVPQQDVGLAEDRHGVEEVQCLRPRQVALPDVSGHAAMLTPLDVDRDL